MNKYREDVLNKSLISTLNVPFLQLQAYDRYKEQPNVLKRAYMLKRDSWK